MPTNTQSAGTVAVTHAFSVKWLWAWCEMHGYKRAEVRSIPVPSFLPPTGRIAVHLALRYSRADFEGDLAYVRDNWKSGADVAANCPPFEELAKRAGLIVGTVAYSKCAEDPCKLALRSPAWLKRFVRTRGGAGWWRLSERDRALVEAQLRRG